MIDLRALPATALTMAEREWLRDQAAALPADAVIVHIGVDRGASVLCSRAGNPEAAIIGIDLDLGKFEGHQDSMTALVEVDSRRYAMDGEVDFLFIDGDHEEEGVKADIENWLPSVQGVVAFHDYGWSHLRWCAGVKAAVDKWDWEGWEQVPAPDSIRAYRKAGA